MDKSPPDLARETPLPLDEELRLGFAAAMHGHGAVLVDGRAGTRACALVVVLPHGRRAHELYVFSRGEGAVDRCIDYMDGVVKEAIRSEAYLPLDWEGRPFESGVVFVRGEVRDYEAEEAAARLLDEPTPPRGFG